LGIADKEIASAGSTARIHLFSDYGAGGNQGVGSFAGGFGGGAGAFADAQNLWNPSSPYSGGFDVLKQYDIVIFSCEGGQIPATKPQQAMDALKQYADLGGRVFLSHWHNIWIEGASQTQKPAVWAQTTYTPPTDDGVAHWNNSSTEFNVNGDTSDPGDLIDE